MTKQLKFYAIDKDGNKVLLDTTKIHVEYSSGENMTIEHNGNDDIADLFIRSYYGDEPLVKPDEDGKIMSTQIHILPGAMNVVAISVTTKKTKICNSDDSC